MNLYSSTKSFEALRKSILWYGINAWPEKFSLPFSPIHYEIDREIQSCPKPIVLILIFRGSAKTTLARTLAAKDLHWGDSSYTVYVGPNKSQANKSVRFIVDMMSRPRMKKIFGDPFKYSTKKSMDEYFHFCNEVKIGDWVHTYDGYLEALGVGQKLQGSNIGGSRLTRVVLDDIEDPSENWTEGQVESALDWFDKTLFFALQDMNKSKIIVLSTKCEPSSFSRRLSQRKNVHTIVYPCMAYTPELAEQFGVELDESLWPEKYPTEVLKEMRATLPGFKSQMLMIPETETDMSFDMSKIDVFDDIGKMAFLIDQTIETKLTFSLDMASRVTRHADKSAIVAGMWHRGTDHWTLEAKEGKWGVIGTIDRLFRMIEFWGVNIFPGRTIEVGIEMAAWDIMARYFNEKKKELEKKCPSIIVKLVELKSKLVSKADRVLAMKPLCEVGREHIYEPMCAHLIGRLMAFHGRKVRSGDDTEDAWAYQRDLGLKVIVSREDEEIPRPLAWYERAGRSIATGRRFRRIGGIHFNRHY